MSKKTGNSSSTLVQHVLFLSYWQCYELPQKFTLYLHPVNCTSPNSLWCLQRGACYVNAWYSSAKMKLNLKTFIWGVVPLFNAVLAVTSEDLMQNGQSELTMPGDFRSGTLYSQCQSELTMVGDFRLGHSQCPWDGLSQTPTSFSFMFPPLNINWDNPTLYSRLPPLNTLLNTLQNKTEYDKQVAGYMTQDSQAAKNPGQHHAENDISQPVESNISQPVESLAQHHTKHVQGNTHTQDALVGAAMGLASNANNSSWAARNPNRPVIEPHVPLNPAWKAHQCKESEEALHSSIWQLLAEQAWRMDKIALEHGISVEKLKKLMGGTKHYTASQSAQLENALMHTKAEEVNEDLLQGAKYTPGEIHQMVKDDRNMQNLTEEEKRSSLTSSSTLDTIFKCLMVLLYNFSDEPSCYSTLKGFWTRLKAQRRGNIMKNY
ncbi:hypothetical protein F4604DRAFT_1677436 [Suillus subluteus]|nr:hypothetical protein F4604DRAFT_1677436 [Suillus subluteus]